MRIIKLMTIGCPLGQRGIKVQFKSVVSSSNVMCNKCHYSTTRRCQSKLLTKIEGCSLQTFNSTLSKWTVGQCYFSSPSMSALSKETTKEPQLQPENDVEGTNLNLSDNLELLSHLERTSLVDFGSEEAVARLEEAIKFSEILFEVNTAGVQPMDSVLENVSLRLRNDEIVETSRDDILLNASVTEEDYFVAPPGNIPLDSSAAAQLRATTGKKSTE